MYKPIRLERVPKINIAQKIVFPCAMILRQKSWYKFSFANFVKSQVRALHTSLSTVTQARKRPYCDLYKMTILDDFFKHSLNAVLFPQIFRI